MRLSKLNGHVSACSDLMHPSIEKLCLAANIPLNTPTKLVYWLQSLMRLAILHLFGLCIKPVVVIYDLVMQTRAICGRG
jgi:hypothetical protein